MLKSNILLILSFILSGSWLMAQNAPPVQSIQASQRASISQTIGIAEVTVTWNRPGVRDREIFGSLVPYDQVWRAGANENTTITFSHPAMLAGKPIPAGTYGLHIIPTENGEWTLILNMDAHSWGSFFYDESRDVVRAQGSTKSSSEAVEWLRYGFDNLGPASADLILTWDKTVAAFPISFNNQELMVHYLEHEYLKGIAGFFWDGFNNAAFYCAKNKVALDKGNGWVETSLSMNRNFVNLQTKSLLLMREGKDAEASALQKEALPLGNEVQVNNWGYVFLGEKDFERALKLFKHNTEKYPESWNVWDSLAEGQAANGDKKSAIKNYKKAQSMTTSDLQKQRIEQILKGLES